MKRLNELEGESLIRLPTEAEWEFAARAGTTGERYAEDLDAIAKCGTLPIRNLWGRGIRMGSACMTCWERLGVGAGLGAFYLRARRRIQPVPDSGPVPCVPGRQPQQRPWQLPVGESLLRRSQPLLR